MAELNRELLQAYLDAVYRVEGEIHFRVGEFSAELAQLHVTHDARHSHLITAFNPASKRLPAEENVARHAELAKKLDELGVKRLPAAGLDPDGEWPPEPGYLVFDMNRDDVLMLGALYQQNAVVSIPGSAIPELVVVADPQ